MAKSKDQKADLLSQYKAVLSDNGGYIAVDYSAIETVKLTDLKLKLKEIDSDLMIVKNNVFKIALSETDQPLEAQDFSGQVAVITYTDDPTAIAKLIKEVQKETEQMNASHGLVDGAYLDSGRAMALAEIPSREVLLAQLLGSMSAPLTGFMSVANGNTRGFVQILKQLSEKDAE